MSIKPGTQIKKDNYQFQYRQKTSKQRNGLDILTYGSYHIQPGCKSEQLFEKNREVILFSMSDDITVLVDGTQYNLAFYDTLYIPIETFYTIENNSDQEAMVIVCKAQAQKKHKVHYSCWKEYSENEKRISKLNKKDVFLMFDVTEDADRLMAGYTIYEPNTRAWPPHNHTDQEEVYIFTKGKGSMEVYADEETKTFVHNVDQYDAVSIPVLNYHPVFSQDEELHFIWCIAGERYWVGDKNKDFMSAKVDKLTT